jgi:UDP-glucose 4-epimerase
MGDDLFNYQKSIMGIKILVTGGTGFIGSHLVDTLIAKGHTVAVLDDLSGSTLSYLNPKATFYQCDIRNFNKLKKIMGEYQPSVIYHLAANAAESKAQFSPVDITSRNYDGAIKTLTAAINNGLKRFVFVSSIAVYGQQQTPFLESTLPIPEDIYGVSKLAFEQSLKILSEVHGFEFVIARPHNVYGPRQNMRDPYRNVVTIFFNALLKGEPFYIYGTGDQTRCFSYVDDVVHALAKCGTSKKVAGMTFNIGSDYQYTVAELAKNILEVSGMDILPLYLPDRPREVKVAVSDHVLSKQWLGYKDKTSLVLGLKKTWQWAKELGYQKPRYTNVEIASELLPSNWRR